MKTTQYKREQGIHTRSRREARAARRVNIDWTAPVTGGLTKGDTNESIRQDRQKKNQKWATGRAALRKMRFSK